MMQKQKHISKNVTSTFLKLLFLFFLERKCDDGFLLSNVIQSYLGGWGPNPNFFIPNCFQSFSKKNCFYQRFCVFKAVLFFSKQNETLFFFSTTSFKKFLVVKNNDTLKISEDNRDQENKGEKEPPLPPPNQFSYFAFKLTIGPQRFTYFIFIQAIFGPKKTFFFWFY